MVELHVVIGSLLQAHVPLLVRYPLMAFHAPDLCCHVHRLLPVQGHRRAAEAPGSEEGAGGVLRQARRRGTLSGAARNGQWLGRFHNHIRVNGAC